MRPADPDLAGAIWSKSSFSTSGNGSCVEVALVPSGFAVGYTMQQGRGPVLLFGTDEWAAFVNAVRAGDFDRS